MPAIRSGNLVTTAGQVSVEGKVVWKGKLGGERTVEEAIQATRSSAIGWMYSATSVATPGPQLA